MHAHTFGCEPIHHTLALVTLITGLISFHLFHLSVALGLNGRGYGGCTRSVHGFRLERSTEGALGHTRPGAGALVAIGVGGMIETFCGKEKKNHTF